MDFMENSLRKNLFKEALRDEVEQRGMLAGGLLLSGVAALTAATTLWLAPVYVAAAGLGALGLAIRGTQGRLGNPNAVPEIARRTISTHHTPKEVSSELVSYVDQAIEAAVEIVTHIQKDRRQSTYMGMRDVVDTTGDLLNMITTMSERIAATEKLFHAIQGRKKALPNAVLQGKTAEDFERNLRTLQTSIDQARQQIVTATASLQQMSVQVLMIQAQDAALIDQAMGSLSNLATEQADQLQLRITAMEDVARSTDAATSRLL
jgi:hypothetical protein